MATLSFNPTRIKTPTFNFRNPISKLASPLRVHCNFSSNSGRNHKKLHLFRSSSVSESSLSTQKEEEEDVEGEEDNPTAEMNFLDPEADPESISEWELDFCSRPILDIRGKKLWELVVCDNSLSLQYTKYFPNNVINSVTLKDAIVTISEELGVPLPEKIRFFRWFFKSLCKFGKQIWICLYFWWYNVESVLRVRDANFVFCCFVGHRCRQLLQKHVRSLA